ncbi:MAG: sensor domain-containing protein [Steroidobacteraceae bacterium]
MNRSAPRSIDRDTEAKVKAAMTTPRRVPKSGTGAFFSVFLDPRAYTSLFFMFLSLATGVIYFTFAVTGLSLSAGLAVLVVGIPFFLVFVALSRVVSLAEGRLIEAPLVATVGRFEWFGIPPDVHTSPAWLGSLC